MESNKQGYSIRILAASAIAGAAVGSILAMLYPELTIWSSRVFCQGIGLEDMPFWKLSGLSCLSLGMLAALGLSAFGTFSAPVIVFSKAAALSVVLARLYRSTGAAGMLTAVLFLVPFGLGSLLIVMLAGRESMQGGTWILRVLVGRGEDTFPLRRYAVWFWLLTALQLGLTAAQYGLIHTAYPAFLRLMTE